MHCLFLILSKCPKLKNNYIIIMNKNKNKNKTKYMSGGVLYPPDNYVINSGIGNLNTTKDNLTDDAKIKAEAAANDAINAANDLTNDAKIKAEAAANDAKIKAEAAANDAKIKAEAAAKAAAINAANNTPTGQAVNVASGILGTPNVKTIGQNATSAVSTVLPAALPAANPATNAAANPANNTPTGQDINAASTNAASTKAAEPAKTDDQIAAEQAALREQKAKEQAAADNKTNTSEESNMAAKIALAWPLTVARYYLGLYKAFKKELEPMVIDVTKEGAELEARLKLTKKIAEKEAEDKLKEAEFQKALKIDPSIDKKEFLKYLDDYVEAEEAADALAAAKAEADALAAAKAKEAKGGKKGWFGGGRPLNLNQIQKGGKLVAKRTEKSINEFLNSSVTSSHILNMITKQRKTKIKRKRSTNRMTKKRIRAIK